MTSALHTEIAAIAGEDPALHIGNIVFVKLITQRLADALKKFLGQYQPYPGPGGKTQIGLKSCSYDNATAVWDVNVPGGGRAGEFLIKANNGFTAEFLVSKNGDANIDLFVAKVTVQNIITPGQVSIDKILIGDVQLDLQINLSPSPNRAANLALIGMSENEAIRLEGLIEGAVAPSAIYKIFRGAPAIDIKSLTPIIEFQGITELAEVGGGLLIIARDGWRLNEDARCPCGASTPEIVITQEPPIPNGGAGDTTGGIVSLNVAIPPANMGVPQESAAAADISIFMPQKTVDLVTAGPYPAITGYVEDNGFIGYSFDYTVAFRKTEVSLTDGRAFLVVSLGVYFNGYGNITVDVPCIGRQAAGRAWMTNKHGISTLDIGVNPIIRPDGKFGLEAQLLKLDLAPFEVDVVTVAASLLSYFGPWGTIAGFVFDRVLGQIIAQKLPNQLRQSTKDSLGKQNWTLIDLSKFNLSHIDARFGVLPAVSRAPDSALVGLLGNRG
jgi:hypothetical protein